MLSLAPEIIIHIFSCLPTPSLVTCLRINRSVKILIEDHDETLWKSRAKDEYRVKAPCDRPDGVRHRSWKDLCKCQINADRRLNRGEFSSRWYDSSPDLSRVWRVQPDQDEGVMFCTFRDERMLSVHSTVPSSVHSQGLRSIDMNTGEVLFTIPEVKGYAHVEYCAETGWLVVTGENNDLLVYHTRKAILPPRPAPLPLPTDPYLPISPIPHLLSSISSLNDISRNSTPGPSIPRGHLHPHPYTPILSSTHFYRALRLVGTRLVTAGIERVTVWDVKKGEEVRVWETGFVGLGLDVRGVHYVEHDDEFVFVLGSLFSGATRCFIFSLLTGSLLSLLPGLDTGYVFSQSHAVFSCIPMDLWTCHYDTYDSTQPGSLGIKRLTGKRTIERGEDVIWPECTASAVHYTDRHLLVAFDEGLMILPDYKKRMREGAAGELMGYLVVLRFKGSLLDTHLATYGKSVALMVSTEVRNLGDCSSLIYIPDLDQILDSPTDANQFPMFQILETAAFTGTQAGGIKMTADGVWFSGKKVVKRDGGPTIEGSMSDVFMARSYSARDHT